MINRSVQLVRRTAETRIELRLALDGPPGGAINSGNGVLDHLLMALAKHGGLCLELTAAGDSSATGAHHLAEDVGIALGEALRSAVYGSGVVPVGQSAPGVARFGDAVRPMDEALVAAAVDLCGRGGAHLIGMPGGSIAGCAFGAPDWTAFWHGLALGAMCALHLTVLAGQDLHHVLEACAKAGGAALGVAVQPKLTAGGTSTKGTVELTVAPW